MKISLAIFLIALLTSSLSASDWPKFLGPSGNGTSAETGLIHEFSESGPPVQWTIEVGDGYGGAAIRDGEVYILDRVAGEQDVLRVFDLESGEELWSFTHDVEGRLMFPGSRAVPTVEEELVYALGGFGHLYCINRETHEAEWIVDIQEEHGGALPMFGYAGSPLVMDDLVIVAPMGPETGVVALDRFMADEVWSTNGLGSSHSTPIALELLGQPQILFVTSTIDMSAFGSMPDSNDPAAPPSNSSQNPLEQPEPQESIVPADMADFQVPGNGVITAVSPEGATLWQSDLYYCSTPIPVPIKIDDEHLFLTGGYGAGSVLLKLSEGDEGMKAEEVFRSERGSQIHVPVRVGDHLYLLVNENSNDPRPRRKNGGLMCIDLQGNEKWRTGADPYFGRGSILLADGMLIIQDGRSGALRLVEPTAEGYRPIAEANVFGKDDRRDHQIWSPLALSDGRLFMRSQNELKCLDLRAGPVE